MQRFILSFFILLCSMASAAAEEPYMAAYKGYLNAMNGGAVEIAADYAEQAWRLAEEAGVKKETVAILAQNFAEVTLWSDPARAVAPASQAVRLGELGFGLENYPLPELKVILAAAKMGAEPQKRRYRRELEKALKECEKADMPLSELTMAASIRLADISHAHDDEKLTIWAATKVAREVEKVEPLPKDLLIRMNVIRAVAMLNSDMRVWRHQQRLRDVLVILDRTMVLFPSQKDIDTFDPNLARIYGWYSVTRALMQTLELKIDRDYEFEGLSLDMVKFYMIDAPEANDNPKCKFEWIDRIIPEFPLEGIGWIGAVVLGVDWNETGEAANVRVLAEVPEKRFTPSVLQAALQWKVDVTDAPPYCLQNRIHTVHFLGPKQ